jgi:hypothetical protein
MLYIIRSFSSAALHGISLPACLSVTHTVCSSGDSLPFAGPFNTQLSSCYCWHRMGNEKKRLESKRRHHLLWMTVSFCVISVMFLSRLPLPGSNISCCEHRTENKNTISVSFFLKNKKKIRISSAIQNFKDESPSPDETTHTQPTNLWRQAAGPKKIKAREWEAHPPEPQTSFTTRSSEPPLASSPSREKKNKASEFQNPPCPAAAAHEPVRGGRRRRRRRRGPGVLGRHREGAAGADAAQGRGVPPRAGLRAAGAGGGRRRAALPVRVRRPPQPPRPLPLHAHPGNAPHTRSSFALLCLVPYSKCCSLLRLLSLPAFGGAVEEIIFLVLRLGGVLGCRGLDTIFWMTPLGCQGFWN